tara:strand:- start:3739 stop:3879 length:141 start_codon:yes stop_codon:yes gene_type:complete
MKEYAFFADLLTMIKKWLMELKLKFKKIILFIFVHMLPKDRCYRAL